MELEVHVKSALTAFQATKVSYCQLREARYDLMQTLDLVVNDERHIAVIPDVAQIVMAVKGIQAEFGAADVIVHLADGYGYTLPIGQDIPHRRPRDAFAAGDPRAFECLNACGIDTRTGKVVLLTVAYKYEGNLPIYDEITTGHSATAGRVVNELKKAAR
jgi:hypothetical protein